MSNQERRKIATELRLKGLTYSEIGKRLGITAQGVGQMITAPADIRKIIQKRAKSKCENCGEQLHRGIVHHKNWRTIEVESYHDLDNLQYLCQSCHGAAHGRPPIVTNGKKASFYRLNKEEIQAMEDGAKALGITNTEFVRRAVLFYAATMFRTEMMKPAERGGK